MRGNWFTDGPDYEILPTQNEPGQHSIILAQKSWVHFLEEVRIPSDPVLSGVS